MTQTHIATLEDAVQGIDFQAQKSNRPTFINQNSIEVACINLLGKLENWVSIARDMDKDDLVDDASKLAKNYLAFLKSFCIEHLTGQAADQVGSEIENTTSMTQTHGDALKTRPLSNALMRTFWNVDESEEIQSSLRQLLDALARVTAITFYNALILIGPDSEFGREIDPSSMLIINELNGLWK